MIQTRFFTSTAYPGYLPDSDVEAEPIPAACLADDLREEWRLSLEAEAVRREMDDREYTERESVGERRAKAVDRLVRLGLIDPDAGITVELPDGQVWAAIRRYV